MAIRVELDIFSGLPNPSWELSARDAAGFVTRARDGALPIREPGDVDGVLGYRGFDIRLTGEQAVAFRRDGLPTRFRLAGTAGGRASLEVERYLVDLAELSRTAAPHVAQSAADRIEETAADDCGCDRPSAETGQSQMNGVASSDAGAVAADVCTFYLTSSTDYTFWNAAAYQPYNNCYNFASNWRTNTFAQPGRGSGTMFSQLTVTDIKAAAARDGWVYSCSANNSLVAALVIWPGTDYHWYRRTVNLSSATCWSHKPGATAAKHTDNSGRQITAPSTCNRGNYTTYGGFMYVPQSAATRIR